MVFPGTSFFLGASDIHQRSNISSMRSFESRWGSKRTMSRGLFRPPRHDRSESTYSYWHPLGYGSSESIAYDRNLAVRTAFSS